MLYIMKILIVGGGIGGLALGSFLEKNGMDYTLIERDKDWSRHGYSIGMWSNGRAVLTKLGLAEKFDAAVTPYHQLIVKTLGGKALKTINLSSFYVDYGLGYAHIQRHDLHDWLLSGLDQSKIAMNTTILKLTEKDKIDVTFSTKKKESFDLVVGAEGIHSPIRNTYFKEDIEHYQDWRCWYAIPKKRISQAHTVTEYLEAGRFLGVFDDGTSSLAIFCAALSHNERDDEVGRIERIRTIFSKTKVAEEVLEGLGDADIMPTDLAEVTVRTWHKGRIALLGDAAHGFEPFAGLGGSMALEDAYVLSAELAQVSASYTLQSALATYGNKRRNRVALARDLTRKMRAWATVSSPFTRQVINMTAPIIPTQYFINGFNQLMREAIQ